MTASYIPDPSEPARPLFSVPFPIEEDDPAADLTEAHSGEIVGEEVDHVDDDTPVPGETMTPLPLVLDPYAVAVRSVQVLIGALDPAHHIARVAIGAAIDNDSSAAIDVVVPRAIALVLRRAAQLVAAGAGPRVVDQFPERLELWRRLASRTGLEPAAVVLSLAPCPPETVAAMLRVDVRAVTDCLERWFAGIDPELPPEVVAPPQAIGTSSGAPEGPAAPAPTPAVTAEPVAETVGESAPEPAADPVGESAAATDATTAAAPDAPELPSSTKIKRRRFRRRRTFK